MKAPNNCPMCGEAEGWTHIDTTKKGFNAKSAIIGGVLLGGVGLAAGAFGKKKSLYICKKCSFQHEYDGPSDKSLTLEESMKQDGFKDTGSNKVWIDLITKATPSCQFCGKPQRLFVKYNFKDGDYSFRCGHCMAEFKCNFTFGGKVSANSTSIVSCGETNINGLSIGNCDASLIIHDPKKIK